MMPTRSIPGFTDPISSWSHLLGAFAFAIAAVSLLRRGRGGGMRVCFLSVFAVSSVVLLAISGVYHMLASEGTPRSVLLRLDKAAIFVLIAGTFTPVQGICFTGIARWGVLALMWILAATGMTLFTVFADRLPDGLSTTVYLALGWTGGCSGFVLWRRYGFALVRPLVLGGVAYSLGAILLGLEWPTLLPGVIGPHELWHVAVLAGIAFHWSFIFRVASGRLPPPRTGPARTVVM
jgi:channel protein (hemolysin III family)